MILGLLGDEPGREVLWNVESIWNPIGMYALLGVALAVCGTGIWRRIELWNSGKPHDGLNSNPLLRIRSLLNDGLLQGGVIREDSIAMAHSLIYFGFLVLLFTTTMVFIDHDLGIKIYHGNFYLWVTLFSDVLGVGVLLGCGLAAHRRYIARVDMVHSRFADSLMLAVLALLIVQGFLLEGLRIYATNDPWRYFSPIGWLVSRFFWALSVPAVRALHFGMWWFHTATVMLVVALIPYTKFFHVISGCLNLYYRPSRRAKGQLESIGDLEKRMEAGEEFTIGLGTIKDYSWKQLLDLDACTSCGRCQDACPAYASGKPLSPKWMVLDTRNHALALQADEAMGPSKAPARLRKWDTWLLKNFFLKKSGLVAATDGGWEGKGAFRAQSPLVQSSVRTLGKNTEERIAGDVMDPNVFWSCNTCMACVEACPVGINHVDMIVGNRRNMVLMQGEVPTEAQGTLRALENRGNPYGPPQDRMKWATDLNVPVLKAGDKVDYLYWVGCVSAFDPRKQKIARSLVKLMHAAGLSFGVLGEAEGCSGDPARRLGEENLFQSLAKKNIELLKSISFGTLVANCPHCFNTIKNEYPEFGNLGAGRSPEIIHHSVLLKRLLRDGKLQLNEERESNRYTFHDPCYLGRYNDEFEAPRQSLKAVKGLQILEMDRNRENAMCCGAGGGHFWMDMKVGQRVNVLRVEQAAATHADRVATACPFCMQMMEDGVKLSNREGQMEVKDIAEVLAERLPK